MSKALITGATGMIGSIILEHCLDAKEIDEVVSISRKKTGKSNPKLTEVITDDFLNLKVFEQHFKGVHHSYFCIGVYTGAVDDDKFKEITVEYTKAFADQIVQHSPSSSFIFLSGAGADLKEKSRSSFARYKGMAENYLMSLEIGRLHSFRPGYIYPEEKRTEPNAMYSVYRTLYPVIKLFGKRASITSIQLAKAMFLSSFISPGKTLMENKDILGFLEDNADN